MRAIEREAASRFAAIGMPELADAPIADAEAVAAFARDGRLLIAECDGEAAGFVRFEPRDGYLYIDEIDVRPRFGGRGVGAGLMVAAEWWAAEHALPGLTLATFRDVPWNGPWYARFGFVVWDDADLPPGHRAERDHHGAMGLDMSRRQFMRKML